MGSRASRIEQREIDNALKTQELNDKPIKKILILGSGSVGKSTVFRAIKIIHNSRKPKSNLENDFKETTHVIRQNCVQIIHTLLHKFETHYPEEASSIFEEYKNEIGIVSRFSTDCFYEYSPPTIKQTNKKKEKQIDWTKLEPLASALTKLWNAEFIQRIYGDRLFKKYYIPSTRDYFMDKVGFIMSKDYVVDKDEYLHHRCRTTGIVNYEIDIKKNKYTLIFYDVGGERNERTKWIHVFDNVHTIFYVCDLSQFCTRMFEDESRLALLENLELFQQLVENKYLKDAKMIVLLNKVDIFKDYLTNQSLQFCFGDDYKGRNYMDSTLVKTQWFSMHVKRIVKELVLCDIKMSIEEIGNDLMGIVSIYYDVASECGVKCEPWLDLVYDDGIQFIKQKFVEMKSDIMMYELCATDTKQVEAMTNDINDRLFNDAK